MTKTSYRPDQRAAEAGSSTEPYLVVERETASVPESPFREMVRR